MLPWRYLNTKGRMLLVACLINMYVCIVIALEGSWFCLFPVGMAAFCGMMTYHKKYRDYDINQQ